MIGHSVSRYACRLFPGYVKRVSGPLFGLFVGLSSVNGQDPATVGQWSAVMSWPYLAVHAHVLPTGKVLWWTSFNPGR